MKGMNWEKHVSNFKIYDFLILLFTSIYGLIQILIEDTFKRYLVKRYLVVIKISIPLNPP